MKAEAYLNFIEKIKTPEEFDTEEYINSHAPKQRKFINSTSMTTMAWGGKRAGKTLAACSLVVIMDHLYPKESISGRIEIAGQSLDKVKDLYLKNLLIANEKLGLKWDYRAGESKFVTPKRNIIFRSLRDIVNADKSVGFNVLMVIIEEAQTIKEKILRHYLDNVIRVNMLMQTEGSRVNYCMNPPVFPMPWLTSNLYENKEVKKIHFTPLDNPLITQEKLDAWLEKEAKLLGYKDKEDALENSNEIKRNILGLWCPEMGRVVIHPDRVKTYSKLPEKSSTYSAVMGVDIGGGKAMDAIVVLIYNKYERKTWLVDEQEINSENLDIEDLATRIKYFYEKWKPHSIALDYGGVGGRVAGVLRTRFGVPGITAAIKKDKMTWVEIMRTEAMRGRLLFKEDSDLLQELPQIIYTEKKDAIDDEQGIHSDLFDACLYAFRHIYNSWPEARPVKKDYTEKRIEELLQINSNSQTLGIPY